MALSGVESGISESLEVFRSRRVTEEGPDVVLRFEVLRDFYQVVDMDLGFVELIYLMNPALVDFPDNYHVGVGPAPVHAGYGVIPDSFFSGGVVGLKFDTGVNKAFPTDKFSVELLSKERTGIRFFQRINIVTRQVTILILSLIHISEPTRLGMISYAVFCLKK